MTSLSPRAKDLMAKARIVSFDGWENQYSAEAIARLQRADDERRYLTSEDLAALIEEQSLGSGPAVAAHLRDHAAALVDAARAQVLMQFPGITEPGGGLYPPMRAEACWRDLWQFLRCATYGIASQRTDYLDSTGLMYMRQLYEELQVPLDAMLFGLRSLKQEAIAQIEADLNPPSDPITRCYDPLIEALADFRRA